MKKILPVGDSMVYQLPLHLFALKTRFSVHSFPGMTAEEFEASNELPTLIGDERCDAAFVCFGTNDIGYNKDVKTTVEIVIKLALLCRDHQIPAVAVPFLPDFGVKAKEKRYFDELLTSELPESISIVEYLLDAPPEAFADDKLHLKHVGKIDFLLDIHETLMGEE